MTTMIWTYAVYLLLTIGVTVWVARTLQRSGRVFLTNGDEGRSELADSLSHLLVVGFYLVNFGVISFALRLGERAGDLQTAVEVLSTKVGGILVALGCMHFLILAVFSAVRRNAGQTPAEPVFDNHDRNAVGELATARRYR